MCELVRTSARQRIARSFAGPQIKTPGGHEAWGADSESILLIGDLPRSGQAIPAWPSSKIDGGPLTLSPKAFCVQCANLEPFDTLSDWSLLFLIQQSGHSVLKIVAAQNNGRTP